MIWTWLFALLSIFSMPGQTPVESPPITLSDITVSTSADASFNLTNRSQKNILGYVLVADIFDSAGRRTFRTTEVRIGGQRLGSTSHHPTQTWRGKMPVPIGAANHKIFVDYVVFTDRSTWGPDVTHHSLKLAGILEGWSMAFSHLRSLLSEGGDQAVASELKAR